MKIVAKLWPFTNELLTPYYEYAKAITEDSAILYYNPYFDVKVQNVENVAKNLRLNWLFNLVDKVYYEDCGEVFAEDMLHPIDTGIVIDMEIENKDSEFRRIVKNLQGGPHIIWVDWKTYIGADFTKFLPASNFFFNIIVPTFQEDKGYNPYLNALEEIRLSDNYQYFKTSVITVFKDDIDFAFREWTAKNGLHIVEI